MIIMDEVIPGVMDDWAVSWPVHGMSMGRICVAEQAHVLAVAGTGRVGSRLMCPGTGTEFLRFCRAGRQFAIRATNFTLTRAHRLGVAGSGIASGSPKCLSHTV